MLLIPPQNDSSSSRRGYVHWHPSTAPLEKKEEPFPITMDDSSASRAREKWAGGSPACPGAEPSQDGATFSCHHEQPKATQFVPQAQCSRQHRPLSPARGLQPCMWGPKAKFKPHLLCNYALDPCWGGRIRPPGPRHRGAAGARLPAPALFPEAPGCDPIQKAACSNAA